MCAKKSQELFEVFREAARQKSEGPKSAVPENTQKPQPIIENPFLANNEPVNQAAAQTGTNSSNLVISYEYAITAVMIIIGLVFLSYVIGYRVGSNSAKAAKSKAQNTAAEQPDPNAEK